MPQLDKGFEVFVNWQTAMFCLGIYFLTYIVRTIVEGGVHAVKVKGTWPYHLWTELALPLGPFGAGVLFAVLSKKFPWPMPIADVVSAKIMYGMICGGMSGWFYSRVRAWAGVAADRKAASLHPPASPDAPPDPVIPPAPVAPEAPPADPPPPAAGA